MLWWVVAQVLFLLFLALQFRSWEMFLLAMWGIAICGSMSAGQQPLKGWISGWIGLLIAFVGLDAIHGVPRFTFGSLILEDGISYVPILIGLFEATSIDRRVKHHPSPRPLTHDLLVAAVELLGGEFQDVVISELKEHTYFAVIRVIQDGEVIEVDARPSDAIAVAVTCEPNLPIYVSEEVLSDVLG